MPRLAFYSLLTAALLGGCAVVDSQPPPVAYRLELDRAAVPQLPRRDGILRVVRPDAVAGVDTHGIAYSMQPYQLRYYTRSRWSDSPARMLGTVLVGAFEASGLLRAVTDDSSLPADHLLSTQLLQLEQDLPDDGPGTVQLKLRLQLIQLPERRLLVSRLLEAEAASPSRDAAGAVAGAHAALEKVVADTVRIVAQALETAPQP